MGRSRRIDPVGQPLPGSVDRLPDGQVVDYTRPMADQTAVYEAEIAPMMDRIIAVCHRANMPFVFTVEMAEDRFCSTAFCPMAAHPVIKASAVLLDNTMPQAMREEHINAILDAWLDWRHRHGGGIDE